MLLLHNKDQQ